MRTAHLRRALHVRAVRIAPVVLTPWHHARPCPLHARQLLRWERAPPSLLAAHLASTVLARSATRCCDGGVR
eukprot:6401185-Alexandrium_andersonii.AAC.1